LANGEESRYNVVDYNYTSTRRLDVGYLEELLSVREASAQSGRNMETVRRWIWSGRLPAQKLGNQLFMKRSDLEAFLKDANRRKSSRSGFIERAVALQQRIRAKTGVGFDVSELIEESRRRHIHER
jgi:excisionase family DNA binding protein